MNRIRHIFNVLFFIIILFLNFSSNVFSALAWKHFGNLIEARSQFEAQVINDSLILIMGGIPNDYYDTPAKKTCELINFKSNQVFYTSPMDIGRAYFTSLLTKDSNVIVIGGFSADQSVELFDRKTFKWRTIGHILETRWQHSASFINDSEIVVVGGFTSLTPGSNTAEILNINTGISKSINDIPFGGNGISSFFSKTAEKIFVFGGRNGGSNSLRSNNVYTYDNFTDKWNISAKLNKETYRLKNIELMDSSNIISCGNYTESPLSLSNQIYMEKNGTLQFFNNLNVERTWQTMSEWNKDSVIVIGGYNNQNNNILICEWLDRKTNFVSNAPQLLSGRRLHKSLSIKNQNKNNRIMAIGGCDNSNLAISSIEILEEEKEIKSNPPTISSMIYDCHKLIYVVEDEMLIDDVVLDLAKSINCKIEVITKLPSKKVTVVVSLLDNSKDGYFYIANKCKATSLDLIVMNSIFSKGIVDKLKLIDQLNLDDLLDLGSDFYSRNQIKKIKFKNISNEDIIINEFSFNNNISFSIPLSNFPKTFKSNSIDSVEIYVNFNHVGNFYDTLHLFIDSCSFIDVPLTAKGIKEDFESKDKCNKDYKLITISIEPNKPFYINPNPAFEYIYISNVLPEEISSLKFYNYFGELMPQNLLKYNLISQNSNGSLELNISNLSSGIYFVKLGNRIEKFIKL